MKTVDLPAVVVGFRDAQAMTRLGRDSLLARLQSGEIRSFRIGSGPNARYRIPVAEIEAWAARQVDQAG